MSPYTAFSMVLMFAQGKYTFPDQESFDEAFDRVLQVLEEANNEKYRVPGAEKEEK